jgi:hypothetical protein
MANAAQGQDRYMQFSSKVTQSPIWMATQSFDPMC